MANKKGQIWIEAVLYTLIGLALIGIALAFITPKMNESKDRAVVEQTIESLDTFDFKIREVLERGEGNIRAVDFTIKKGELYVDAQGDRISIILEEIGKPYSQEGVDVPVGNVRVRTEKKQKSYYVNVSLSYDNLDLKYDGEDIERKFTSGSLPYKFSISNEGNDGGKTEINVEEQG